MPHLDLDQLRTLVAIVNHASFGAAAVQLGKTQSAITQQMQRLQEQVGHPLFDKRGRNKHLTEHGERLLVYARHLLSVNDEALRHLQRGRLEGLLRIGAPHDVADTMLPQLLSQVMRGSPGLQLDVRVGRSPFLMESLKKGEIDMTVSNRVDADLQGVLLRTTPTVWLCGVDYLHDRTRPVPMIMADGPSIFRRLAEEALDGAGVSWLTKYTCSSLIGIRAALRAGLGVTARGVEQLDQDLRMLGPADGLPPLPDLAYRLYVRNRVVNPVTRQVFELIRDRLL